MEDSILIRNSLKDFLKDVYPHIEIRIEQDRSEPDKLAIYFIEEKFKNLYRLQRNHYLIHHIPKDFYQKYLVDTYWYELAPGEDIEDLDYYDDETIDGYKEFVLKILNKIGFFQRLDDLIRPENSQSQALECCGDFSIAKNLLTDLEFNEKEQFDICHVFMREGAFCDCEILLNLYRESRQARNYWEKRFQD